MMDDSRRPAPLPANSARKPGATPPAQIAKAALLRLAQARPGSQLSFVEVGYEAALDAQAEVDAYLAQVRRLVGLHALMKR